MPKPSDASMMSQFSPYLIAHAGKLLIERSESLIALITKHGELIEWSESLGQVLARRPGIDSLLPLLDPSSRTRFLTLIQQAITAQRAGPITLNFIDSPIAIPQSYRCYADCTLDAQIVLLAEPIPPLDQRAVEEYMQVTSELSTTTRTLQKVRHHLEQKQQLLEDALAQIEKIAHIDDLTQIPNRRNVMIKLDEEVKRAQRYGSPVSILLIDIDLFKHINDCYGHQMGDQVLRSCATLLQRSIRTSDHLGRYGGEEFLAVLPMCTKEAAADMAERLRRRVAEGHFAVSETTGFSITISIGVSDLDPQHDTLELLIAHADHALYMAKEAGRNQVQIWRT
ncbi:MAG: GGDEF domain-containing protein [Chloroflexales bacterium]